MDFDTAKENIQPLASGRNAEQLEVALNAESDQEIQEKVNEQRKEFERTIASYEGDDPLQPWYDYIVWIEQIYPKSGKESAMHEILSKCLALFEKDERYFQDRRMLKMYIKYIDSEPNPPQFYEQLFNNGIGTMIADLYLCWAHYYDYCDNFEKAEAVYQKGLRARAQPLELIEQAHRQFGFSMSQRILYKDESTRQDFRSTMEEKRLALTSLRAHKHRHVGSIRTGSAVKSVNPGRLDQSASTSRRSNRKVQVFEDGDGQAPTSPTASTSVVQTILNSTKKQENMREPGPWNKAKLKSNALFTGATPSKPSFPILVDEDIEPIPLPESENNYIRGIQLPKDFVRKNLPQEPFSFPLHRDEDPAKRTSYKYDKFMLFPTPDKCYSWEELQAYKWFKKRNIENNFTRTQNAIWNCGYDVPIRLPPHFARKNAPQDKFEWDPSPFEVEESLKSSDSKVQRKFGFNINLVYTPNEEYSPEEILQSKWLNGDLMSQKDAEMEITCGFDRVEENYIRNAKRRSMALGGRKSILPRKSYSPRKSINPRKSMASTSNENASASVPVSVPIPVQAPEPLPELRELPEQEEAIACSTGVIKRSLPKRKSVYMTRTLESLSTIPETASPPASRRKLNEDQEMPEAKPKPSRISIFEDIVTKEVPNDIDAKEEDESVFKVPQSARTVPKPRISSAFQDEDLDGCTTQTFNFFIKSQSISTPKEVKQTKILEPETAAAMRRELDFGSDDEASPEQHDGANRQVFACRSGDSDPGFAPMELNEIYRQKLSAIMETTEECATTVSSLASGATTSSKSSSAEEFDFTKHTNQQSSVAMLTYRHHTIVNSTAKISASNVSVTNRENESKKCSAIGFEIYQEEASKVNDNTLTNQPPANTDTSQAQLNKTENLSRQQKIDIDVAFDKTLPPAGQFHIYEDENDEKPSQTVENPSILIPKQASSISTKGIDKEVSVVKDITANAQESISQEITEPSKWQHKIRIDESVSKIGAVSKCQIDENMTLTTAETIPHRPTKTGFQMAQENTGLTLPMINFSEERTERIPTCFNANQTNFTQPIAPVIYNEAPSMFIPELPDTTRNLSKLYTTNNEPAPKIESVVAPVSTNVADQSVFEFGGDDTVTSAFAASLMGERNEAAPKLPNPMSLFDAGNLSAFHMIPDMPTMPEIDINSETMKNVSHTVNQSKADKTLKADKTQTEPSTLHGIGENTDLISNKSHVFENKTSRQSSAEWKKTEKSMSKQSDKTQEPLVVTPVDQNKPIFIYCDEIEEKENLQTDNIPAENTIGNKSVVNKTATKNDKSKVNIDDEFFAMINSPVKSDQNQHEIVASPSLVADKTSFLLKSFSVDRFEKSETNIDDEMHAMIKSPFSPAEKTLPAIKSIRESVAPERQTINQISLFREPSMSLLEPMRRTLVRQSAITDAQNSDQKDASNEVSKMLFSDDNPNTAMFSLHMPSIKNSTILINSKDNINNITDELKTSLVINKDKSIGNIPETSNVNIKESPPNVSANVMADCNALVAQKTIADIKFDSIHIKEEQQSFRNKTVVAEKSRNSIDELYACIQETATNADGYLDLSIELTSAEKIDIVPNMIASQPIVKEAPNFLICNPVSIRPSQFPMNETRVTDTTTKDDIQLMEKSLKEVHLNASQQAEKVHVVTKPEDMSLILVDDTDDLSSTYKTLSAMNKTRRDTIHSPFKNRYATNPRLNETINAVKEIDPFDMHLQNAFLDDIDFIEYIRSLENVNIVTRVRPIELNTELEMGTEIFSDLKQIGQGSFGFVYCGKSNKTGKLYALKQERPANHWEFYISLEIASRIEDPKMLPGFMSIDYALVGHNSSIFATQYCEYGSLFDVCNRHKLNTCRYLDEGIAMIFSEQMLSILDHLHASNIIHGDIKPDNILLMKKLSYGCNELVIKLIDFGRSIDLNFFPPNQTFTSTLDTKNFTCTEILESKPWKHQIDLFCLASTMYTLVCGKYMNIKKNPESKIRPYVLSETLAPYLDVALWEHVLYSLINVPDHKALPDLQKLRLRIREAIVDKEHIVQDQISKFNAVLNV